MNLLARLPAPLIYALSAALEKSFALFTIPLMAAYMSPADYGNFDVTVVFADLVVLIVGLGMAEQLIRFASTASSAEEERQCAGEITGSAFVIALLGTVAVVLTAPYIKTLLGLNVSLLALTAVLVASCFSNLIELPLTWLRLKDDAAQFMRIVLTRTLLQVGGMTLVLTQGYGAEGVLLSNSVVLIGFSLWLLNGQNRATPMRLSKSRFVQIGNYGAPVLGAMLAMYLLGGASRLFLSQTAADDIVGQFGLASRFAMATVLLLYPLELWWLPKRIAALKQPGGLEQSARVWGVAVTILVLSGMGVCLLAPVFIVGFLPVAYAAAISLLPVLVVTETLRATAGITEVGCYARETGYRVMLIDGASAVVAVVAFMLLIPPYGAYGAAAGMALGQVSRITGYVIDGKELAPIPYAWLGALATSATAGLMVYYAPDAGEPLNRVLWTSAGVVVVSLIALVCGLLNIEALKALGRTDTNQDLPADSPG